jgi:tRNA(His) 5'-end guanylyltransferase
MKRYEAPTQLVLPRRTYTIMRVDGRAFHTWTRGLAKPYDMGFMRCMDAAAIALCEEVSGAKFAFVQSDEISLLARDFDNIDTQAWFDGNIQKWVSVGASIASTAFNTSVLEHINHSVTVPSKNYIGLKDGDATFDARVFTIPDRTEVENYFIWRQKDAVRNSVTMLAQAYASHKQLQGKTVADRHEIIHKAGDNWAKHPVSFKHGRVIRRHVFVPEFPDGLSHAMMNAELERAKERAKTSNWIVDGSTPIFTVERKFLTDLIPVIE